MKLVARSAQFHVYDDVLSENDFRAVWNYVQLESYVPVHHDEWAKVWRISDGIPLGATAAVFYEKPKPAGGAVAGGAAAAGDARRGLSRAYPTHSGLDRVLETIVNHLDQFAELVGKRSVDFDNISARSYLYPQGTGLSWHEDDIRYSGGYAFYAHPEWNCQWGGELLIADESTKSQDLEGGELPALTREEGRLKLTKLRIPRFLDNARQDTVLGKLGMGVYIVPKPNRLVVIAGGNPHMINKVSPSAGDHVRCTIAGFFHCPS
jgi:hypothetical protein